MIQLKNLLDSSFPPNATILVRVDFNVPFKEGQVADDTKIRSSLGTIRYLLDRYPEGKIVLISHRGRPLGVDPDLSLEPVASYLSNLLGQEVFFCQETIGHVAKAKVEQLKPGSILLLENVRFYEGEQRGDYAFAKALAELGNAYVNEAFAVSHRSDASVLLLPELFAPYSYPGFSLNNEIVLLNSIFVKPNRPFMAIIGGAKLSTKLPLIQSLLQQSERVLVGGLMAYTLLRSSGFECGETEVEVDLLDEVKKYAKEEKLSLPIDHLCCNAAKEIRLVQDGIPAGFKACDIGPQTAALFLSYLKDAKTIFWCGPLGRFEEPPFDQGSLQILRGLSEIKAQKVGGGGDTLYMIESLQQKESFTRLTTGGGATIAFIEEQTFPSLRYLRRQA